MATHRSEGRKPRARERYVASVEGTERGVPFRVFYKRMATAESDAIKTRGVLTDLFTLRRRRYINGQWRDA